MTEDIVAAVSALEDALWRISDLTADLEGLRLDLEDERRWSKAAHDLLVAIRPLVAAHRSDLLERLDYLVGPAYPLPGVVEARA